MPSTVLAVASNALLDACVELGLERDALIEAAGLDAGQLEDPDARIPALAADGLWAAALAQTGDPLLALHAAEALPFGAYRVIDFLVAHAPTLADALERCAAYFPLIDPRGHLDWRRDDEGRGYLSFTAADGRPLPRPAVEYTFAAFVLRTRAGCGVAWTPAAVEMRGPEGPEPSHTELTRVFGVEPDYLAAHDRLVVEPHDCTRPSDGANRALFEVLDNHAKLLLAQLPEPELDLVRELRAAIEGELRGGRVTLERVARGVGLSGRTLQRRLDEEGLRFGELVDAVKAKVARAYLDDRSLALCEVAFLLGFADQSAFTRAFKRWTGDTPGRYRKRARTPG